MITCDKCGKKLGFFERRTFYDDYGNEWHLCRECKKLIFLDDLLRERNIEYHAKKEE